MPKLVLRGTFAFALALVLGGCGYNTIQGNDEAVKAAWSEVENQYQRRADLIPNLVETVKGYAKHEDQVLKEVTEARAQVGQVKLTADALTNPEAFRRFEAVQQNLGGALSRLMVVAEQYPNLKANENFRDLQAQLEGTENRITVARKRYIESVQTFNTSIKTLPGAWTNALFLHYPPKQSFTAPGGKAVETPPAVKF